MTKWEPKKKTVFTETEIVEMFINLNDVDKEFKGLALTRINAMAQAMYNCVHDREKTMIIKNTHGDDWVSEYNRFVELYQKYHS